MKLLRYGPIGKEKPAVLDRDGNLRDLSGTIADLTPDNLAPAALDRLRKLDPAKLPPVTGSPRIGACVANIPKLVCIGLNYHDHANETGNPIPKEPILFMKATSSIVGPSDDVILPKGVTKAQYVSEADALNHVAGYCIVNDVSERAFQMDRGGQWTKGKSCDTFAPIGPWLVTADEVSNPQALDVVCEVSGQVMQKGTTRNMIFGCAHLVSYVSQFMTLMPGDIIPTGTPAGVGLGMKPPRFLKPGDTMRLTITGLGEQRQRVLAYPA
jgi:2-keto-4-pentenoate hydratase/2-oxohepta-3-ene-1,7-dioic acid hydratase in catechol pathway